jgi:hypothetical protein
VGWGQFMPFFRYQEFQADTGDTDRFEVCANYIIEPYNAFLTGYYGETDVEGVGDTDSFTLALQMQF